MTARKTTIAVLFALLVSLDLVAEEHKPYTDEQIRMMIEHDLSRKHIDGVSVTVSDGIVDLQGSAASYWAREEANEVARSVHDVKDVRSEVVIAPAAGGDEELATRIRAKVLRSVYYTIFDQIGLSVKNGEVTLFGKVTTPYKAQNIVELASKQEGVQKIDNKVEVLPVSPEDERLRNQLATEIYQEFPDYASLSSPPIHIIVENARVTLFGIVRNEVERHQILNIARSAFGVMDVEDKLAVGAS